MKKKTEQRKLEDELWEHCKRITRARYALKSPTIAVERWNCFTCGRPITSKQNAQTGHFIAKSVCGAYLKYDLRNLRIQCIACNVWQGGNGAFFYKNLVSEKGQEYVDELFRDKNKIVKASDHYKKLLEEYKKL